MRNELQKKKLGEVCDFVRGPFGGSLKKDCFKQDGYAVYEQQHAIYNQFELIRYFIDGSKFEEMKRFEVFPGDLIMSCSGTMGKVAIVPDNIKKGIINQALLKLSPSDRLDIRFLKYWMESNDFQESISKHSQGAAIKNVASVKVLKEIELPCPKINEQQQIVAILDKAFAAINQAKANVERNLQNAKELFQSKLNEIFSQKGDGWVEKKLGEVCGIIGGGTPSKSVNEYYGNEIFWATVRDMNNDLLVSTETKITELGLKNSSAKIIPKDHVIIATRVGLGKVCMLKHDTAINQDLKGIIPKSNVAVLNEFLFWWLKSISDQIVKAGTGATVQGVKIPFIASLDFPLTTKANQLKIINQLSELKKKITTIEFRYQKKVTNLEELKKSVLQKAFSGELTSVDIEEDI